MIKLTMQPRAQISNFVSTFASSMTSGARKPYSLIIRVTVVPLSTRCAKTKDEYKVSLQDKRRSDHVRDQLAEPNTIPQAQEDHPSGKNGESAESE